MDIWTFRKLSLDDKIETTLMEGEHLRDEGEDRSIFELDGFYVVLIERGEEYVSARAYSEDPAEED